jgi:phenylacetate-CoA ligase
MVSLYGELARHVLAPAFDRLRGSSTMRRLSHLERSQWWPRERIEAQQQVHLRELIAHIYAHVPYYRRVMDDRGLRPDDIRTTEALRRLPILTKAAIRANFREMLSDVVPPAALRAGASGGTTGERLRFYSTRDERLTYSYARWTLTLLWTGVNLGEAHISIRQHSLGTRRGALNQLSLKLQRLTRIDTMTVNEENLDSLVRTLQAVRPRSLFSYPSALALIADHARRNRIPLPHMPAVCVGGERLLPRQRALFEEEFGSVPFVRYGSNELHEVAGQCEERDGLHILAEDFIVEVVDERGTPLPPGRTGHLVITSLHNYGMPFVRYSPGDIGALRTGSCLCGRGLPLLDSRIGRTRDYVRANSGAAVPAMDLDIEAAVPPGVLQYQLVQEDVMHCRLRFVPCEEMDSNGLSALGTRMTALLSMSLGEPMQVTIEPVNHIEMNLSGKRLSFVSRLTQAGDAGVDAGIVGAWTTTEGL